jgi:hypothetical protein
VKKKKNPKKREGEGLEGENGEESQKENNAATNESKKDKQQQQQQKQQQQQQQKKKKKQRTLHGNFTNDDDPSGNVEAEVDTEEDSQQGVGDSENTKATEAITSTHVHGQQTLMSMWGKKK